MPYATQKKSLLKFVCEDDIVIFRYTIPHYDN